MSRVNEFKLIVGGQILYDDLFFSFKQFYNSTNNMIFINVFNITSSKSTMLYNMQSNSFPDGYPGAIYRLPNSRLLGAIGLKVCHFNLTTGNDDFNVDPLQCFNGTTSYPIT